MNIKVARRLAALFADDLPAVPILVRTYGKRATEIAENPRVNPKGTRLDGAFKDYIGCDGRSLWAAATSGPGAVEVHLLACMIARIWTGQQATSIWSELVESRKAHLQQRTARGPAGVAAVAATAQISITREQLARWDSSARYVGGPS